MAINRELEILDAYSEEEAKRYAHRYVILHDICENGRGRLMVEIHFWFYKNKDQKVMPCQVLDTACQKFRRESEDSR